MHRGIAELQPWKGNPTPAHYNRHKLHPADRERVKAAYELLGSWAAVARLFKVSEPTLRAYVRRHGLVSISIQRPKLTARESARLRMQEEGE